MTLVAFIFYALMIRLIFYGKLSSSISLNLQKPELSFEEFRSKHYEVFVSNYRVDDESMRLLNMDIGYEILINLNI